MKLGNWTICFNGEIYNYEELKNKFLDDVNFYTTGDTEVLLNLWIKFGEKCLGYLKGMWAFSIYNELTNELYLVRDSFGIKPLYYFLDKKEISWSSDLRLWDKSDFQLNDKLINTFIMNGRSHYSNQTFFLEIATLEPGTYLRYSEGLIEILSYEDSDMESYLFNKEIFQESLNDHCVSDVNIGLALSGGIDSSSILLGVRDRVKDVFTGINSVVNDDEVFARHLAQEFDLKHYLINVGDLDLEAGIKRTLMAQQEPFDGFSIVLQNEVYSKIASAGIKVNLSGQGADEMFLGYKKYLRLYLKGKSIQEIRNIYNANSDIHFKDIFMAYMSLPWLIYYVNRIRVSILLRTKSFWDYYYEMFLNLERGIESLQRFEIFKGNLQSLLKYEDRNSMAYSVESRVPYVYKDLFRSVCANENLLKHHRFKGELIKNASLPDTIVNRKSKLGFHVDISEFLTQNRLSIIAKIREGQVYKNYLTWIGKRLLLKNPKYLLRIYILELWLKNCR